MVIDRVVRTSLKRWLTQAEACQHLAVSRSSLYRERVEGRIHALRVRGRVLYDIAELDKLPSRAAISEASNSVHRSIQMENGHADKEEWEVKEDEAARHLAGRSEPIPGACS